MICATTSCGQLLFWFCWPPPVLLRGPDPGLRVAVEVVDHHQLRVVPFLWWPVEPVFQFVLFPPSFLTLLLSLIIFHILHFHIVVFRSPPLHPLFFVSFPSRSQRCNVPLSGRTYDGLLPVRSLCDSSVLLFSFRSSNTRDASAQNTSLASMLPGVRAHLPTEGKRA